MKRKFSLSLSLSLFAFFLALTSLGWGQNVPCNANTNWCGPYTPASYAQLNHAAFQTTNPQSSEQNSWGLAANDFLVTGLVPGADVVPNGAMGQDQFLEVASRYVQAYERNSSGLPIFSNGQKGAPAPQAANSVWEPNLGKGKCGQVQVDVTASHDPGNSIWILSTTANLITGGQNTDSFVCIAVSLGEDLQNAGGGYQSFWNGYAFDLGLDVNGGLLPTHLVNGQNVPDIADYARFGAFGGPTSGSYYIAFDLINQNPPTGSYGLEGFAVCQIPQAQLQGSGTNSPTITCYRYVVPAAQLTQHPSLIHTLLPADADSNSFANGTAGEYFLATENPSSGNSSSQLAFWTWSMIAALDAEIDIPVNSFTPGCYDNAQGQLENTFCAPQSDSSTLVDGLGDRLMSRLAYRNLPTICVTPRTPCGELLAVTQTTAVSQPFGQTQIRYYTLNNLTVPPYPTVEYQGQISDSSLFFYMPSNAIDKNGDIGYTFTGSGATTHPQLYFDTLNPAGGQGTAKLVPGLAFDGSENTSSNNDGNQYWGEYVSTTIDPTDDLTFWSVGEYFEKDQSGCTGGNNFQGCSWFTAIFSCKKGDSNCP